jgi:hypothetical protein
MMMMMKQLRCSIIIIIIHHSYKDASLACASVPLPLAATKGCGQGGNKDPTQRKISLEGEDGQRSRPITSLPVVEMRDGGGI